MKSNPGLVYAFLAYGFWGGLPIYLKFFDRVPAVEVLCHRVIWSAVLLIVVLAVQKRLRELQKLWRSPRFLAILLLTALLLSCNWGIFIYGVNSDRVVECSLGYFINPLFSVLLGFIFLKERLNLWQVLAVVLAALGVGNFILDFGQVPWLAFALAVSFGLYGLLRKITVVPPMTGLAVETLLMTPIALAFTGHWAIAGSGSFGTTGLLSILFIGCGVVTSLPLLWFANAARRLQLSTLGLMQYIAPSLQLICGVFLYQEPFTRTHLISFSLIWIALAIYSGNSLITKKKTTPAFSKKEKPITNNQ
ncbi:MAG: EamA family transporter RarD [Cyanobacteria bacterium SBLK]|nr:EamA family transporter RarD [Cyanobacteria bacterium SBLK]